ncbi:hypothetical protein MN608_11924 [Microdochium nivale]|nr:hypothetical protein MN608_11924 [Microdochium nivale]
MQTTTIDGPGGPLELLYSLPPPQQQPQKPPVLFVHGAMCSARDYMFLLPHLAARGYPAYAVSVRGHGASQRQSFVVKMLLTTVDSWAHDISAALTHIAAQHPHADRPPVLAGHSLGGGFVQYMASVGFLVPLPSVCGGQQQQKQQHESSRISGLILLAAAPLSGRGAEINTHWHDVEKTSGLLAGREKSLLDRGPPAMLQTPGQVRAVFFSQGTEDEVCARWIAECKTSIEGAVAGLRCFWKMGEYDRVLKGIGGFVAADEGRTDEKQRQSAGKTRKILFVSGGKDVLVPPEMVDDEYNAYSAAARKMAAGDRPESSDDETCLQLVVEESGHHLMMDAHWEKSAQAIVAWLDGLDVVI